MAARLAVLVDGDNISGEYAEGILGSAHEYGSPDVVRVYANAQQASAWHSASGFRMIHAGTGKNASDLLLTIDAMELALRHGVETFVIASSDSDFLHLAQRLREYGKTVQGIGEAKTPGSFRNACSSFLQVGEPSAAKACGQVAAGISKMDLNIRAMIQSHSKNGKGMQISQLSAQMHKAHGTQIGSYPEKTWRAYLLARPQLYEVDPRGPEAMVRFKPEGFADKQ